MRSMTPDEYLELGRFIWQTYVPKIGQSETVQGELLRAIEKLRDESHRNGNMNWDRGNEILARYIRETLIASPDLSQDSKDQLQLDIDRVMDFDHPYTEDDLFDRIEYTLLDWCSLHRDPVPRTPDPELNR